MRPSLLGPQRRDVLPGVGEDARRHGAAERVRDVRDAEQLGDQRRGELALLVHEQVGPPPRATGSRSSSIGGVRASAEQPREHERRPAPPAAARRPRRSSGAPRPAAPRCSPAGTVSMPAAATRGQASAAVAHSTSCPAASSALASGTIGRTCP